MAITWELKITPIDISTKEASIVATRTDDIDPENPMVYNVARAILGTTSQKNAVLDEIWAKHQSHLAEETIVSNFVSALETSGKSNLEGRE